MKLLDLVKDKYFWVAVSCGPIFWGLLWLCGVEVQSLNRVISQFSPFLQIMLVYPVLEEIVFRGGVQEWLSKRLGQEAWYGIGLPNLVTSLIFTAAHFFYHPPLWALAVFFPSLVFGFFKDRHGSLAAPIILHVFYNTGYALLFMSFSVT